MYCPDSLLASIAKLPQYFPAGPSHRLISQARLFVAREGHTGLVLVIACSRHSHRSFGYHSPLCRAAGRADPFCAEVQDFDLASHKELVAAVEQDRLALLRRDLEQTGGYYD
jgi:hypothetical protein